MRKHRDTKLVTTERRVNCFVSEPNYHATKFFTKHLLAIEMKKTQILMNKPVYLLLLILETSKILMYQFWYDYVKLKYGEKAKLYCKGIDICILYLKTNDIYKDVAEDVEARFDTSNYELDRPLPKGENKKVIALMKDELGGKIMIKFLALRAKTYNYLVDHSSKEKKGKRHKKVFHKNKT